MIDYKPNTVPNSAYNLGSISAALCRAMLYNAESHAGGIRVTRKVFRSPRGPGNRDPPETGTHLRQIHYDKGL